jgi:DNA polymerase/3'-5' exonuclease PolX
MKTKRPLSVLQPVAEELLALLSLSCRRISIAGSIRRRCAEVGDIELVAVPRIERVALPAQQQQDFWGDPPADQEVNFLWRQLDGLAEKIGPRFERLKWGDKYRAFRWPLPHEIGSVQVDLFTAEEDNWGLILLIRTGSAKFSQHVVTQLKRRGTPSQGGYVRGSKGTPIPTPTEEEVFRLAGMQYHAPEERGWVS